ncbi:DUF6259 domain-containing protein [Streptosporangium sp. NPDC006013]|uniref:DUF6259 domain-containing protein n=1 Tax=Streptosporangium sp. NPDC006013 TaxID=3155596 RepID=UPI0033AF1073
MIGDQRDVAVHSEQQRSTVVRHDDTLVISYNTLTTVAGATIDVDLVIVVSAGVDELSFRATGEAGTGITLREMSLPIVELAPDPASQHEVLYRSEGLGRKIERPRTRLARAHSEYMRDDSAGIWEQSAYPGEMSMPWQGVESGDQFLYLARHDPDFRGALFSAGIPARGTEGELWLSVVTPLDRSSIDTGEIVIALLAGGWRAGARRYREWADSWYHGPPASRSKLKGWQRIIMRHQFGAEQFHYDDLVPIFELGREHGLDGILLFGWWKAGFDRGYPIYEADEELGGAEALARAIKTINDRGGFISLYANGNIIDRTTQYYSDHADEVTKKDFRGLDYVAGYDFAGESLTMRYFAAPSFVAACHGAPRWRDQMASVAATQASLGARSVFFDQTGFHLTAWPCYDERHEHGERTNLETTYRAQTFKQIREAADGAAVGSEGMVDNLIPLLDFNHGLGFAFQYQDEAFPGLFRTAFPEPVVSNRFIHDERPGWEDQLNFAFAYNLAFDVAIHRARRTIDSAPAYADRIRRLVGLRREHARIFDDGSFELIDDGTLLHTRYSLDDDQVDIYWNRGSLPAVLDEGLQVHPSDVVVSAGRC